MKQQISILGCGWLGAALALHLHEKGHQVFGANRSLTTTSELKGIIPFQVDISKRDNDYASFLATDVLIIAITSKSLEDFKDLILHIEKSKVQKVIFISSTSVYANSNSTVTEETQTKNTPLSAIEKLFQESTSFKTTLIRFGGLFGYNRKPGNFFKPGRIIENPEGFINFIHRDDCIGIIEQIIAQNKYDTIFNGCANDHPTRRAFYTKEAAKVGRTDLEFNEQSTNDYKIISSQKVVDILNYDFKYGNLMEC